MRISASSRAVLALPTVLSALALLLSACGSGDSGSSDSQPHSLNPKARIANYGGTAPFTAHFAADVGKKPVSYRWTFDDGTSSTEQNPTHTFNKPGFYFVILDTRDLDGNTGQAPLYVGVWTKAEWEAGVGGGKPIGKLDLQGRQKTQLARSKKRRAETFARLHAEAKRQAEAEAAAGS